MRLYLRKMGVGFPDSVFRCPCESVFQHPFTTNSRKMCSSGTADQLHRDYEDLITNSSILHLDDLNLFEHVYSRLSKKLLRDEHCSYLRRGSLGLGPAFTGLDASQPWLCYWISHTYRLLGRDFDVSGTKIA